MKRILAVLVLFALLGVGAIPALATPIADLNDLARYYPADTPIFAASRVDDAFFEELDGVVAKVAAVLPSGTIPPVTIAEALDMALADSNPPMNFQEDIRPWLGDTVAFGVLDIPMDDGTTTRFLRNRALDNDAPVLVTFAITDRAAATAFFADALASSENEVERVDEEDYTRFNNPDNEDGIVVIRDDVLMVTNTPDAAISLPDGSLSSSADFNDTFALLPETDYNMSVFLNLPQFLESALANDPDVAAMSGAFGSLFSAVGPQAWGATLLDGVGLTIDVAQRITDPTLFEDLGISITDMPAIDPAFASRIPAGAPLVIQGVDINRSFKAGFGALDQQMAALAESDMADSSNVEEMQQGMEQMLAAFTAFTGLDLEDDVMSWMTGNYALFLMLNPELNLKSQFSLFATFPVDFGLAIEATDPAAAAKTVEGFTEAFNRLAVMAEEQEDPQIEATVTTETMVGTDVTVLTLTSDQMPWPIELLMAANDEVFALGTRSAVQAILSRDGGLAANPAYVRAQDFVLEGASSLGYLGPEGLMPLADLITTFAEDDDEQAAQNADTVRNILGLISSAVWSQTMDENGNGISRFSLILSE